jgi:hypothetical protein
MLYMSGGGVQIFSMGIVAMLLLSPFKNLSSMNEGASVFRFRCATGRRSLPCYTPHLHSSFPPLLLLTGSIPINSFCAFRAWSDNAVVVPHNQINLHSPAAETRLSNLQHPHPRTRPLEMSVHGVTPDGHWRLARVREPWVPPGDFVVLVTGFRSSRHGFFSGSTVLQVGTSM